MLSATHASTGGPGTYSTSNVSRAKVMLCAPLNAVISLTSLRQPRGLGDTVEPLDAHQHVGGVDRQAVDAVDLVHQRAWVSNAPALNVGVSRVAGARLLDFDRVRRHAHVEPQLCPLAARRRLPQHVLRCRSLTGEVRETLDEPRGRQRSRRGRPRAAGSSRGVASVTQSRNTAARILSNDGMRASRP